MSRFGKKKGSRRLPKSRLTSKGQMRRGLIMLLAALVMVAVSAIFIGSATAAAGDTVVQVPPNPATIDDPCGPDNATWILPANADTDQFDYSLRDNHVYVRDTNFGEVFPDGQYVAGDPTLHDYGTPPDSGAPCAPDPTPVTPTAPSASQPSCDNQVETVTPSSQDGVIWDPSGTTNLNPGQSVTYTALAAEGYVIEDGAQTSFPFHNTFDNSTCDNGGDNGGGGHNGDNGTVKTHNVGTPTSDVSDEPKLGCSGFYLDAFGFDGLQQISWSIVTDTHGDTVLSGTITLDADGHGYTDNLTLPDGMYKLYWHFQGQNGADKHKVFKVEGCAPPVDQSVTPTKPSVSQAASCANTYEVITPSSLDGVVWNLGQVTLKVGESVTFIASPAQGFKFPADAQTSWSFTNDFDTSQCSTPPPATCPKGSTWTDLNHNGVVDVNDGECSTLGTPPPPEVTPGPTPVDNGTHHPVVHEVSQPGIVAGPQLGTGSDGPTGLSNVSTTSPYMLAGLFALFALVLGAFGTLDFCRAHRGSNRR